MVIGGTSIDYAQRVLELENNDLLQKRNSDRRAEQIPEMTGFVNDRKLDKDINSRTEKIHENDNIKLEKKIELNKEDSNNVQAKLFDKKTAEHYFNQGLISQTLSLSGQTNDLLKTITSFKNSLSNI